MAKVIGVILALTLSITSAEPPAPDRSYLPAVKPGVKPTNHYGTPADFDRPRPPGEYGVPVSTHRAQISQGTPDNRYGVPSNAFVAPNGNSQSVTVDSSYSRIGASSAPSTQHSYFDTNSNALVPVSQYGASAASDTFGGVSAVSSASQISDSNNLSSQYGAPVDDSSRFSEDKAHSNQFDSSFGLLNFQGSHIGSTGSSQFVKASTSSNQHTDSGSKSGFGLSTTSAYGGATSADRVGSRTSQFASHSSELERQNSQLGNIPAESGSLSSIYSNSGALGSGARFGSQSSQFGSPISQIGGYNTQLGTTSNQIYTSGSHGYEYGTPSSTVRFGGKKSQFPVGSQISNQFSSPTGPATRFGSHNPQSDVQTSQFGSTSATANKYNSAASKVGFGSARSFSSHYGSSLPIVQTGSESLQTPQQHVTTGTGVANTASQYGISSSNAHFGGQSSQTRGQTSDQHIATNTNTGFGVSTTASSLYGESSSPSAFKSESSQNLGQISQHSGASQYNTATGNIGFGRSSLTSQYGAPATGYGSQTTQFSGSRFTGIQNGATGATNSYSSQYGAPILGARFGNNRSQFGSQTSNIGVASTATSQHNISGTKSGIGTSSSTSSQYEVPVSGSQNSYYGGKSSHAASDVLQHRVQAASSTFGTKSSVSSQYGTPESQFESQNVHFGSKSSQVGNAGSEFIVPGALNRFGTSVSSQFEAAKKSSGTGGHRTQYSTSTSGFGASTQTNGFQGASSTASNRFGSSSYGVNQAGGRIDAASSATTQYGAASGGYVSSGFGSGTKNDLFEPAHYEFSYQVHDTDSGSELFSQTETREDNRARGVYRVLLPDGRLQIVEYEADEEGFKPKVRYEVTGAGASGYVRGSLQQQGQNQGPY